MNRIVWLRSNEAELRVQLRLTADLIYIDPSYLFRSWSAGLELILPNNAYYRAKQRVLCGAGLRLNLRHHQYLYHNRSLNSVVGV